MTKDFFFFISDHETTVAKRADGWAAWYIGPGKIKDYCS